MLNEMQTEHRNLQNKGQNKSRCVLSINENAILTDT